MSSRKTSPDNPAPRALIRADGSNAIGMGHIARCLTLAHEIKRQGGECVFVTRRLDGRARAAIGRAGFQVRFATDDIPVSGDIELTLRAAKRSGAGVIVTDGYHFKEDYLRGLKDAARPLVCIDDLAHTFFPCDILLNQNVGATPKTYHALMPDGAKLLIGTRYALVRDEFIEARRSKPPARKRVGNVLVSLGGGDSVKFTLKALRELDRLDGDFTVTAVFGSRGQGTGEVESFLSGCRKVVNVIYDARNMAELMLRADMAVTGGGTTCYEAACVGLPNLVMVLAENQWVVAKGLHKARASVNLGWHGDISEEAIARAAKRLADDQPRRATMQKSGRALVDGRGANRVVTEIKDLIS